MNHVVIGGATLFQGDCMDYMCNLPDKVFDLAIVDPQYGINAPNMGMGQNKNRADGWAREESTAGRLRKGRLNSGGGKLKNRLLNTSNIGWDDAVPDDEYFIELMRVSKNQIIWGGNYFDLGPTRCILCWDKRQPWENFSQWEMAWTSFDQPAALFSYSNTGGNNGETKTHPTQKPAALYSWILSRFAKPGDRILDTHGGSMSSVIACLQLGFEVTCCERDPDYFATACARIENSQRQQPMFAPERTPQVQDSFA